MSNRKRKKRKMGRIPTSRVSGQWKHGASLQDIANTMPNKAVLTSGGANSGVSQSMLWAGRGCGDSRDVDAAIVSNSTDPDAWSKLGYLKISECNDLDLAEWMIGWAIPVEFQKQFWKGQYFGMMGICHDVAISDDPLFPPEVKIYADAPERNNRKRMHKSYMTSHMPQRAHVASHAQHEA